MDPFRDGERQRELQAASDADRDRQLAGARLLAKGALGAAVVATVLGAACCHRLWDRWEPDGSTKFIPPDGLVEIGLFLTLVLFCVAVFSVRELRRTTQREWIGYAAIGVAMIDLVTWALAAISTSLFHLGIPH